MFVIRVLKKIHGSIRDELTEGWRKLHNKELHNLCLSPDITRKIKSRRMRWAGHVVSMREMKNVKTFC
jgi:1,2-phenylacetyl-CoA epoxidase catalytic subunit